MGETLLSEDCRPAETDLDDDLLDLERSLFATVLSGLLLPTGDLDLEYFGLNMDLELDLLIRFGETDLDRCLLGDLDFDLLLLTGDLGVLDLDLFFRGDLDLDRLAFLNRDLDLDLRRPMDLDRVRLILLIDLDCDRLDRARGVLLRVREGDLDGLPLLKERDLVLDLRTLRRDNDCLDLERRIRPIDLDLLLLKRRCDPLLDLRFLFRDLESDRRFLFSERERDLLPARLTDLDLDLRFSDGDLETRLLGLALLGLEVDRALEGD